MPRYDGNVEQGPATNAVAITPDDGNDFSFGQCRGLYVGVAGNVTLDTPNQTAVLHTAVPAGAVLPVAAVRVRATGTTASGIVAWY
jgi:hypothetical protein